MSLPRKILRYAVICILAVAIFFSVVFASIEGLRQRWPLSPGVLVFSVTLFARLITGRWFWQKLPPGAVSNPVYTSASKTRDFRLWAAFVDLGVAYLFTSVILNWSKASAGKEEVIVSILSFGLAYAFRDFVGLGRSLGKRLWQLIILDSSSRKPCSVWQLFYRNLPCLGGFASVLAISVIGNRALATAASAVIMLMLMKSLFSRFDGRTHGDNLASTDICYVGEPP